MNFDEQFLVNLVKYLGSSVCSLSFLSDLAAQLLDFRPELFQRWIHVSLSSLSSG